MPMGSLGDNEVVSWDDLATSGFAVIGSPSSGPTTPSKAEASAAYDLSTVDLSALDNSEVLTKLNLAESGMYAYGLSDPYTYGGGSCSNSPGPLCDNPPVVVVYARSANVNTLGGKKLFYNDFGLAVNSFVSGPGSGCFYAVTYTSSGTKTGGTVSVTKLIEVDSSGIVLSVSDCF